MRPELIRAELLKAERGGEWRFLGRFALGYGALSIVCLALGLLDPPVAWLEAVWPVVLLFVLMCGPAIMLLDGWPAIPLFAIETAIFFGLVLCCAYLWSRDEAACVALASVTVLMWIGSLFLLAAIKF